MSFRVAIAGKLAIVEPSLSKSQRRDLEYMQRELILSGSRRNWVTATRQLFEFDSGGRMVVPAGAVGRLVGALRADGHDVRILGRTPNAQAEYQLDREHLRHLSPDDQALATAIANQPLGVIEVDSDCHVIRYLAMIARLFPRARLQVPMPTIDAGKRLRAKLSSELQMPIGWASKGDWACAERVVVCTYRSYETSYVGDWHIAVFSDGESSTADMPSTAAMQFPNQRVYAFVDPRRSRSRRDELRLLALAGDVIYTRSSGARPPKMRVQMCELASRTPPSGESALDRKRRVWADNARNSHIGTIAMAFATGDVETLWGFGIFSGSPELKTVAVLVDSRQHAIEVAKCLAWRALDGQSTETGVPDRSVSTLVHAARQRSLNVDVLIRADTDRTPLDLRGFPLSRDGAEQLLIELVDPECPRDVDAANQRAAAYEDRGYYVELPQWLRHNGPA